MSRVVLSVVSRVGVPPRPRWGMVVGGREPLWLVSCQVWAAWRVSVGVRLWGGPPCAPVWQCPFGVWRCRLGVRGGAVLASLPFPSAVAPALSFSQCWWPSGGSLPPCCVAPWCPASVGALLSPCAFPHPLERAFSLLFPFPVPCWRGGDEVCRALMARAWGWAVWSHRQRASGVQGGAEVLNRAPEGLFQCPRRHGGLRGGVVGVGAEVLRRWRPSRLPALLAHLTQQ